MIRLPYSVLRVALVAALVGSCSPLPVAEFLLTGGHFEVVRDLPYDPTGTQTLDVYSPDGAIASSPSAPVVVFLYGGRWQSGSKSQYTLVGDAFTRHGIVTVLPDYTLYPDTLFPGWVEEGAKAVAWTRENISRYGGDPDRIVLMGHSAGAHTAALLALDERYLREVGVPPEAIVGTAALSGPLATEWTDEDVQALMGPRSGWEASYPTTHVDGSERPLLLLHGGEDETLSPRNSTGLAEVVERKGGCVRTIL
jgi:acetyl esterase/lipase